MACGQCIGCRLERSRQWAVRCVHENLFHEESSFLTLTYDDNNLPYGNTLVKADIQKFMKRLKKPRPGKIRQLYCGEYGDTTYRPHYHAIIFGYRPPDPELFAQENGINTYTSKELTALWGMGHCTFGDVTFESAAYCARYCTKKITGDAALEHYRVIDEDTGEVIDRVPEFMESSRRPGLGTAWLEKYGRDAYEKDEVVMRSKAFKPPRYYDKMFEITDPQTWQVIKLKRRVDIENHIETQRKRAGNWTDASGKILGPKYVDVKFDMHSDRRLHDGQIIAEKRLQQRENFQ